MENYLRLINSIGKQTNGRIITDKEVNYTGLELETKVFVGEVDYGNEGCTILGVEKSTNGELKYLIKMKSKNVPERHYLVDSSVMSKIYPEMIIEFYEKITTWN